LFLSEFEGLTDESIAETLGITRATAKIRLFRARQQLKAALSSGCCLSRDERGVLVCTPR
jgi:DNA-directed RNA polymerase specialized sigma24 family protein